jgi:hypothetical protein
MRRHPGLALAAAVSLVLAAVAEGARPEVVEPLGYAGVRTGMTLPEASAVFGPLRIDPNSTPDETGSCTFAFPLRRRQPAFMLLDGRVERIDVRTRAIPARNGILVGDLVSKVYARFGRTNLVVTPHKYDPKGTYIEVKPRLPVERGHRLIFETSSGRVTQFRGGRLPAVRFIEGCA